MKKSLNNIYKGRRLVTGDENELNPHEIMLNEEDSKIVVKGIGESGKVEILSGGNEGSNNLVYYYMEGSKKGVTSQQYFLTFKPFSSLSEFLTQKSDFKETSEWVNKYTYKRVVLYTDPGININYYSTGTKIDSPYNLDITVNSKSKGINVPYYNNELLAKMSLPIVLDYGYTNKGGRLKANVYDLQSCINFNDAQLSNHDITYDATSNILLYYSYQSSHSVYINISKELAKTLKVYYLSNSLENMYLNGEALYETDPSSGKVFKSDQIIHL